MRLVVFLVLLAALSFAAVWTADHPGRVVIRWEDYRIETSAAVLVGAAALLVALALVVYRVVRFLVHGPRAWASARARRRERRGYLALTQGLVAAAAGDAKGARRLAKRANALLGEPPLTLLLSAQAAQLEGDDHAAKAYFNAMLERPETEFLGLRGLLVDATKARERAKALELAMRAYRLKPHVPWVLTTLLDLQTHAGRWIDAEATLASAQKHRALEAREVRRRRALILFERAKGARRAGRAEEALGLAREAHAIEPGFVPATVLAGELLVDAGRGQRARGLLAEAWRRMPHPELARVFGQSLKEVKATERVERLQKLVESTSEHPESRLALAEALLRAGLWGLARGHLEALAESRPSAKAYRLMAELEEKEGGEAEAARAWLIKASAAPPDPAWVCEACGAASEAWAIHCPACEAFDALAWRQPPAIVRLRVEERAAARTQTPAGEGKGEAKARDEAPEKRPAAS